MSESDESNMPPFIGLAQPRPEFLPCGHHHSLMLKSAETGEPSYCELCDCIGRRNDFETELNETKAFVAALQGLHAGDVSAFDQYQFMVYPYDQWQFCGADDEDSDWYSDSIIAWAPMPDVSDWIK